MSRMKSLQGHFLVAARALQDPNFNKTVVLIVQHDSEGALGLVLNRPVDMTLRELWEQVSEEPCDLDAHLHQGGPCNGPLMALHTHEAVAQITVTDGVHFSADSESIHWLVANATEPIRFFAGYSGWSPGQLENELEQGAWLTAPADGSQIFAPHDKLWAALMRALTPTITLPDSGRLEIPDDPSNN
jgi:putative transcriptional regulator